MTQHLHAVASVALIASVACRSSSDTTDSTAGPQQSAAVTPGPSPAEPSEKRFEDVGSVPTAEQPVPTAFDPVTPNDLERVEDEVADARASPPGDIGSSEFDALLVRISKLEDPRGSTTALEEDNEVAWAHYKAKRFDAAAQYFARVAAREQAWKHAHNIACASALLGRHEDARIALGESLRRGGEEATRAARRDRDLASVRGSSWFEPLVSGHAPDGTVEERDDHSDPAPPPNCPPDVQSVNDQHHCWYDAVADWRFEEVEFDTPVDIPIHSTPARPAKRNWARVTNRIPWKEIRAKLDIQHTIESFPLTDAPHVMNYQGEDTPLPDDATTAFFWWPTDDTPVLVLPHRQKLGRLRFTGVILARQTDAGWRAVNLDVVTSEHDGWGGSAVLESGVGLRADGRELFTLTQIGDENEPGRVQERHLCRIRWKEGRIARACANAWRGTGFP